MKKLFVACGLFLTGFANAEIVTNSKGEKIELKSNGTWVNLNQKPAPQIDRSKKLANNDAIDVDVPDGENNLVKIKAYIRINGANEKQLTVGDTITPVQSSIFATKLKLKNKYSFVPKSMSITQDGNNLIVYIEYIAQNSYGANVVGSNVVKYELGSDGYYSLSKNQ